MKPDPTPTVTPNDAAIRMLDRELKIEELEPRYAAPDRDDAQGWWLAVALVVGFCFYALTAPWWGE